ERALVGVVVGAEKRSLHEAHVGVKPVARTGAGRRVGARSGQREIGLTDDAVEIEDQRRVAPGRMRRRRFWISGGRRAVDRTWKEEPKATDRRWRPGVDVGNWILLGTRAADPTILIVIVVFTARGRPQPSPQDAATCASRDSEKPAA